MISKHTPPGTRVMSLTNVWFNNGCVLQAGKAFTVREIALDPVSLQYGVRLNEVSLPFHPYGMEFMFDRKHFNVVELPKCLTEILTNAPKELETVGD